MSGCQDITLWGTKGCQDRLLNWLLLCLCHLCLSKTSNKLLLISLFTLSTHLCSTRNSRECDCCVTLQIFTASLFFIAHYNQHYYYLIQWQSFPRNLSIFRPSVCRWSGSGPDWDSLSAQNWHSGRRAGAGAVRTPDTWTRGTQCWHKNITQILHIVMDSPGNMRGNISVSIRVLKSGLTMRVWLITFMTRG